MHSSNLFDGYSGVLTAIIGLLAVMSCEHPIEDTNPTNTTSVVNDNLGSSTNGMGNFGGSGNGQDCFEFDPFPVQVFDMESFYFDWESSHYNLPYTQGSTYLVGQGNNTGHGHSGFWQYGYDFVMDIGTEVLASREGIVIHANDGAIDGDPNKTNLITIMHEDGTVALYSHLTTNGVLVESGQKVNQGDLIGLSGNTGNTGGIAHLHFSLHPCAELPGLPQQGNCPTYTVTFKNTEPNPYGLGTGKCYTSL